jgi:hypothetical protein
VEYCGFLWWNQNAQISQPKMNFECEHGARFILLLSSAHSADCSGQPLRDYLANLKISLLSVSNLILCEPSKETYFAFTHNLDIVDSRFSNLVNQWVRSDDAIHKILSPAISILDEMLVSVKEPADSNVGKICDSESDYSRVCSNCSTEHLVAELGLERMKEVEGVSDLFVMPSVNSVSFFPYADEVSSLSRPCIACF